MAAAFSNFFKSMFTEEDIKAIPDPEPIFTGTEEEMLSTVNLNNTFTFKLTN